MEYPTILALLVIENYIAHKISKANDKDNAYRWLLLKISQHQFVEYSVNTNKKYNLDTYSSIIIIKALDFNKQHFKQI